MQLISLCLSKDMAGRVFDVEAGRIRQHQHNPRSCWCSMDSGLGHFQLVSQQSLTIVISTASRSFDPA